jgi:hypothetical protein
MAARILPFPTPPRRPETAAPLPELPREDIAEILREAGLPRAFPLDWLLDRAERRSDPADRPAAPR